MKNIASSLDSLSLSLICSYSIPQTVFSTLSLVCRAWNQLIESRDFYERYSKGQFRYKMGPFKWIESMSCVNLEFYELIYGFIRSVRVVKNCDLELANHVKISLFSSSISGIGDDEFVIFYEPTLKLYKILQQDNEMIPYRQGMTPLNSSHLKIVSAKMESTTYYTENLFVDHIECKQCEGVDWFLQQQRKYFPNIPTVYFFSILEFYATAKKSKFSIGGELIETMRFKKLIQSSDFSQFKHFSMSSIGEKASNIMNYPYEYALERLYCRGKLSKELGVKLIGRGFNISVRNLLGRSPISIDLLNEYCKVRDVDLLKEIAMTKSDKMITNGMQIFYYFTCCIFQIPKWLTAPSHPMLDYFKKLNPNIHFPFESLVPPEKLSNTRLPKVCFLLKKSFQECSYGRIQLDRLKHVIEQLTNQSTDIQYIGKRFSRKKPSKLIEQFSSYDCILYCIEGFDRKRDKLNYKKSIDYKVLKHLARSLKRVCLMFKNSQLTDFGKLPIGADLKHVKCSMFEFNESEIYTVLSGKEPPLGLKDSGYKGVDPREIEDDDEEDDMGLGFFN